MIQDKRLDKVEGSLTARQAVILWLEEIRQYQNVYEYVKYLRGQPESAAPIFRLTGQINHSVREAMKGHPKEVVQSAVRQAVRDVVFLIKLHHQPNFKALTEQRAWSLLVAVLAEMQNRMLTEDILRNVLSRRGKFPEESRNWHSKLDRRTQQMRIWKEVVEAFLVELYAFRDAVTFIGTHYFDCHQVLFPDADKYFVDLIGETEELVRMFNEWCTEKPEQGYRIDLEHVRKSASNKAIEQTTFLVDMAKAEALDALGEQEAGIKLAERHL